MLSQSMWFFSHLKLYCVYFILVFGAEVFFLSVFLTLLLHSTYIDRGKDLSAFRQKKPFESVWRRAVTEVATQSHIDPSQQATGGMRELSTQSLVTSHTRNFLAKSCNLLLLKIVCVKKCIGWFYTYFISLVVSWS